MDFIAGGNALRLVPSPAAEQGRKLVARMRDVATDNMSTDEIMALTRD